MARNIFSRALMSVFMDKKARDKYDAIQETKRQARRKKGGAGKKSAAPATAAKAPPPPTEDEDVLPETLIHRAIEAAGQELERKKNLPPGRQALIEQALSIHDQQSRVLDDLPQEQREKLMVMAMHAFGADMDGKTPAKKKQPKKKPSR